MRRRFTTLILLAVAAIVAAVLPPSAAQATELPLGKANFAIAVGSLKTSSMENWVRLGQYTFSTAGTVTEKHWHWHNADGTKRASTGFSASGCTADAKKPRDCTVMTAGGWQSTAASGTLSGTYAVTGDKVRITWSGGQWEEWTLTSVAGGAMANVEFSASNFGITHGFGAGSNAGWDQRTAISSLSSSSIDWSTRFVHRYYLWKTTDDTSPPFIDHADGGAFWLKNWKTCTGGQCIAGVTNPKTDTETVYYISPARSPIGHRRDTLWGWRTANADGRGETCYTGNSHVKPMIQLIDDNGGFHGWTGVEASINQSSPSQGARGDDIGVFRIQD